jgi:TetR/AcrR family transcriptional regulator
MTDSTNKPSRRDQILHALAEMLEQSPGSRITTARLAERVGVSEAALYRHFPSKAKMFEGLIEFIESTLFSRISRIVGEQSGTRDKCGKILLLLLTFTQKNPGITRILTGDALTGETGRLRVRVAQLYDRLETQLRQTMRESEIREGLSPKVSASVGANLMLAAAEGRISQFVRSDFQKAPTDSWESQWKILADSIF